MNIDQLKLDLIQRVIDCEDAVVLKQALRRLEDQPVKDYELPDDSPAAISEPPTWYGKVYGDGPIATEAQVEEALQRLDDLRSGRDPGVPLEEFLQSAKEQLK